MKKQIKINIFNIIIRSDYFQFGSVFIKKNNQIEIFKKKTETGSNRPISVKFGFLGQKPIQTGLARFFPVWLDFFPGFFQFGFSSIWFFRF